MKDYQLDFFNHLQEENDFEKLCKGHFPEIRVEFSARMRCTWKVEWGGRLQDIRLRVPASLQNAPVEIKKAVLQWGRYSARRSRNHASIKRMRQEWEKQIRDYLYTGQYELTTDSKAKQKELLKNKKRLQRYNPYGNHHDLKKIFSWINTEYFNNSLKAVLTWSSRIGGLSTHRVETDDKGKPIHLITISRGYDFPDIPEEIVGGVVYHECLHIVIPPRMENGRRVVHGPDFRKREKLYRNYSQWINWHKYVLPQKIRILERENYRIRHNDR